MSNKLNKQQTTKFYSNPETGYSEVRSLWSSLVKSKVSLTATDYLFYLTILGKDLSKSFKPITNKVKLDNGQISHQSYNLARRRISINYKHPFGDLLTDRVNEYVFGVLSREVPTYVEFVDYL